MKRNIIVQILSIYSIVAGVFLILYGATADYFIGGIALIYVLAIFLIGIGVTLLVFIDHIKFNIQYLLVPLIILYVILLLNSDTLNTLFFQLLLLTEFITVIPIGLYVLYFLDKSNKNNDDEEEDIWKLYLKK